LLSKTVSGDKKFENFSFWTELQKILRVWNDWIWAKADVSSFWNVDCEFDVEAEKIYLKKKKGKCLKIFFFLKKKKKKKIKKKK